MSHDRKETSIKTYGTANCIELETVYCQWFPRMMTISAGIERIELKTSLEHLLDDLCVM